MSETPKNGAETMPTTTFYWKGFLAEYTGESEVLHGRRFYEAKLLEGYREGDCVWTPNGPKAEA